MDENTQGLGRQDPAPNAPLEEKLSSLASIERLLTPAWLTCDSRHPVAQLWARRDWTATAELLTLGGALHAIERRVPSSQLRRWAQDLRGSDSGNRSGATWEILSAGLFDTSGYPVEIPPANHQGYDFRAVTGAEHALRVSCKSLIASEMERSFTSFSARLFDALVSRIGSQKLAVVLSRAMEYQPPDLDRIVSAVSLLATAGGAEGSKKGWDINVSFLAPAGGRTFHPLLPSLDLVLAAKRQRFEQKRFENKVREAISKFVKYVSPPTLREGNLVAIRLSPSISFGAAKAWLHQLYASERPPIAGVFALRTSLRPVNANNWGLVYEVDVVPNPHSVTPLSAFTEGKGWHFTIPIGHVVYGDLVLPSAVGAPWPATYLFTQGLRQYYHVVPKGGGSFQMETTPGVTVKVHTKIMELADEGLIVFSPRSPPTTSLVLLG